MRSRDACGGRCATSSAPASAPATCGGPCPPVLPAEPENAMMHLGSRPPFTFPAAYKQYKLLRTHGLYFALPIACNPDALEIAGDFLTDPTVLSATTLDEIRERIDARDGALDASAPGWEGVRPGDGEADTVA